MDLKMDEGLKALLEQGKDKGYMTYSQVNDYLPDDAVNPEKLDQLLLPAAARHADLEAALRQAVAYPGVALRRPGLPTPTPRSCSLKPASKPTNARRPTSCKS